MLWSSENRHVFVSYRGSRKDLAIEISNAARENGWVADTIEQDLEIPYPRGSAHEFKYLTDRIAERIKPGCTFVMMASDDASESHWVLLEGMEGFSRAYRVIICWVSGSDPLKVVFPLSKVAYRIIRCPQSFIVDARGDPHRAVAAVTRILNPSRRYRNLFRLQQVLTNVVCAAFALLPLTVLLGTALMPVSTAASVRSLLLRPWVCLFSLWLSVIIAGAFYPSYGGPSRLAPEQVDRYVRLVTPGFTGWRWRKLITPMAFVVACLFDGVGFFTMESMSIIGKGTYIKAFVLAVLLSWGYQRIQLNLFSHHIGATYRRLLKQYGIKVPT